MKLSEILRAEYKNTMKVLESKLEGEREAQYKMMDLQERNIDIHSVEFVNALGKGADWENAVNHNKKKATKLAEEFKNALFIERELNE